MFKFLRLFLIATVVSGAGLAYAKDIWYCPMHPHYTSDKPGNCPICGMTLVKQEESKAGVAGAEVQINLTTGQMQLMGVKTVPVIRQEMKKSLRTPGYVSSNVELYRIQNEYINAYVEYVTVFRDYRRIKDRRRTWESHRDLQVKILEAKDALLKLGLSDDQIMHLQKVDWTEIWNQPQLMMFDNNRNYWVIAQVFEQDLGFVTAGQEAEVSIPAYHEKIKGVVRAVGAFLDPTTRSVNALVELTDYSGELTANMLADVDIKVELNDGLMVPKSAVMDTGVKKIVYVEEKPGVFMPHPVEVVAQGDNGWMIKSGLKEGDQVAVEGNFLIDSESRLQEARQ